MTEQRDRTRLPVRREVVQLYRTIGNLLNTIEDDDQRELVQSVGEAELNDLLYEGATSRRLYAPLNAALSQNLFLVPVAEVVDLHSVRVERQGGDVA